MLSFSKIINKETESPKESYKTVQRFRKAGIQNHQCYNKKAQRGRQKEMYNRLKYSLKNWNIFWKVTTEVFPVLIMCFSATVWQGSCFFSSYIGNICVSSAIFFKNVLFFHDVLTKFMFFLRFFDKICPFCDLLIKLDAFFPHIFKLFFWQCLDKFTFFQDSLDKMCPPPPWFFDKFHALFSISDKITFGKSCTWLVLSIFKSPIFYN